jgi:hypothetical protein
MNMLYIMSGEPSITKEEEERHERILDADYTKVEVDIYVQELKHLSKDEKHKLAQNLKQFTSLFGGGMGVLNIKPINLDLIDGGKPYHAKPFPVPHFL